MINRVSIENFKSIGEPGVDLELKPLTLLTGPNGSGKSSVLDAITFGSAGGHSSERLRFEALDELHFGKRQNTLRIKIVVAGDREPAQIPALPDVQLTVTHAEGRLETKLTDATAFPLILQDPVSRATVDKRLYDKVFPIRASRGTVLERTWAGDARWVGTDGANTLSLLERLGHASQRRQRASVQRWATRFGMGHVAASLSLAARDQVEGSYSDLVVDTDLNLTMASSGSRQILPIIVELFASPEHAVMLIEEPEISLHPEAQVDVLEMFADAMAQGKQIVATTHGPFMLQGLGYAVRKGWLAPDQVAVYHLEKKKGTGTVARRLPMTAKGYIKNWIPSFTKVERELLEEWAKGLPRE